MKSIKLSLLIFVLSILLITGMANAATLTPVGTCVGTCSNVNISLMVDDVTGIDAFDVTVTGNGLTTTPADVSKTGSIAEKWMVYNVSIAPGGVRIIAAGGTGSGTTGAGNLGTIMFTAIDGSICNDNETTSVVVNSVTTGITFTSTAYVPLICCDCGCISWDDVIAKYNQYVSGTATWSEVITCYTVYTSYRD